MAANWTAAGGNGIISDYTPPSIQRVSYALSNVDYPPQYFKLPSYAETIELSRNPLEAASVKLIPSDQQVPVQRNGPTYSKDHPRHTLPISSLAIDSLTPLQNETQDHSPAGILYMGGRDGMISSWELDLPMRSSASQLHPTGQSAVSDSIDGSPNRASGSGNSKGRKGAFSMRKTGKATFRQCIGSHTDWINDILLCNDNQTVISASSDRTVNLWNPHDEKGHATPHILGTHKDYVRALTQASQAKWVASGSFDRTIKVWDTNELRHDPIVTFPEAAVQSSVYALAANPGGHIIASGSPEKVIRLWDAKSGLQISKLVGHSDTVRSILLSQDGSHLLSASADSTIRLWSVREQRCLHTFTHHSDSVWTLYSDHPDLDVFYSGDRDGLVCKVDWDRCADVTDGECVVIAHDSPPLNGPPGFRCDSRQTGVQKVIAIDNSYIWTANTAGDVCRWQDIPLRSSREALYPITASSPDPCSSRPEHAPTQLPAPRVSALKSRTQSSCSAPSSVSFAEDEEKSTWRVNHATDGQFSPQSSDTRPAMFGIPFESLVCLLSPNDAFTAAIGIGTTSARGKSHSALPNEPKANAIFSSASLVSIPSTAHLVTQQTDYSTEETPENVAACTADVQQVLDNQLRGASARPTSVHSASWRFAAVTRHSSGTDYEQDTKESGNRKEEEASEARLAYEERELALDATPLRREPEETIRGIPGLIRSCLLNDRRHCLTIDAKGSIYIWDILSGRCLGGYLWEDALKAAKENGQCDTLQPGEALDIVREHIQGNCATPNWCSVETKTGNLTIHLENPRCFDAEIYLDECEDVYRDADPSFTYKEDQRANIGRMVLLSLFSGFISQERFLRIRPSSIIKEGALAYEVPEQIQGAHSTFEDEDAPQAQNNLPADTPKPGMTISLSIPAKTQAALSNRSPLTPNPDHNISNLQRLINENRENNEKSDISRDYKATKEPIDADYFSIERRADADVAPSKAKNGGGAVSSPSGFMSRLRMGLRRDSSPQIKRDIRASGANTPGKGGENGQEETDTKSVESVSNNDTQQHLQRLRSLFKEFSQLDAKNAELHDVPFVSFPRDTAITLSESSHDSGGFQVTYRGLVASTENDVSSLEMLAPLWLLKSTLLPCGDDSSIGKEKGKLTFLLVPKSPAQESGQSPSSSMMMENKHPLADGEQREQHAMASLPGSNTRLTATPNLRIKKSAAYIADRLGLFAEPSEQTNGHASISESRRSSASAPGYPNQVATNTTLSASILTMTSSTSQQPIRSPAGSIHGAPSASDSGAVAYCLPPNSAAHDFIHLSCNDILLPNLATLAQVQRYIWKSSAPIKLEYFWKRPSTS